MNESKIQMLIVISMGKAQFIPTFSIILEVVRNIHRLKFCINFRKDACSYGLQGTCLSPFNPGSGVAFAPYEYLTQPHCVLDNKPSACPLPSARLVSNNLVNRTSGTNITTPAPNVFVLALAEFVSFDSVQSVYDSIHDGGPALSECSNDQKTIYASYLQTPKTSRIKINCFDQYNALGVKCLNFVRTQKVQKECNLDQGATVRILQPI